MLAGDSGRLTAMIVWTDSFSRLRFDAAIVDDTVVGVCTSAAFT